MWQKLCGRDLLIAEFSDELRHTISFRFRIAGLSAQVFADCEEIHEFFGAKACFVSPFKEATTRLTDSLTVSVGRSKLLHRVIGKVLYYLNILGFIVVHGIREKSNS